MIEKTAAPEGSIRRGLNGNGVQRCQPTVLRNFK